MYNRKKDNNEEHVMHYSKSFISSSSASLLNKYLESSFSKKSQQMQRLKNKYTFECRQTTVVRRHP